MKKTILPLLCTVLATAMHAAIPVAWNVDVSRVQTMTFDTYRGETLNLSASLYNGVSAFVPDDDDVALYWQTNGMGQLWWSAPASLSSNVVSATWAPSNDVGAAVYNCFIGSAATSYRAAFRLRLVSSPGAVPSELELPVKTFDFNAVTVLNPPYYTQAETDTAIATATNALAASALMLNDQKQGIVSSTQSWIRPEIRVELDVGDGQMMYSEMWPAIIGMGLDNYDQLCIEPSYIQYENTDRGVRKDGWWTDVLDAANGDSPYYAKTNDFIAATNSLAVELKNKRSLTDNVPRDYDNRKIGVPGVPSYNYGWFRYGVGAYSDVLMDWYSDTRRWELRWLGEAQVWVEYDYGAGALTYNDIDGNSAVLNLTEENGYSQTVSGGSLIRGFTPDSFAFSSGLAEAAAAATNHTDSAVSSAATASTNYTASATNALAQTKRDYYDVSYNAEWEISFGGSVVTGHTLVWRDSWPSRGGESGWIIDGDAGSCYPKGDLYSTSLSWTGAEQTFDINGVTATRSFVDSLALSSSLTSATNALSSAKQDVIDDIDTIRSDAALGAAASAAVESLQTQVTTIGAHLNAEDARYMVTNYNSAINMPEANAEVKVDGSWIRIWSEMTRWNWALTNYLPRTYYNKTEVDAALADKADLAWGYYDSHTGNYAPDGYTWLSSPYIAIAGGLAYQRTVTTEGAVWVLTSNGLVTETSGVASNGFFRVSDDEGGALFEIVKGDKRTVGATAVGISTEVVDGVTHVTIPYVVESAEHPTVEVCTNPADAEWYAEDDADCPANVSWSGSSGAWSVEVWGKTPLSQLFVKASYETGGETYIRNNAPVGMSSIYLNGVKYTLGTATISGHTVLTLTPAN